MLPKNTINEDGKYMQPIVFYDFETTDANPETCGIHQLSGAVVYKGKIVERFNWFLKPKEGCSVSPYAMYLAWKANGFKTVEEMRASDIYEPQEVVYRRFMDLLIKYSGGVYKDGHPRYADRVMLGGYNIHKFDNEVLRNWMAYNNDPLKLGHYIADGCIDLQLISGVVLGMQLRYMNNFKLKEVAWALGVKVDESKLHSSDYDTEMCLGIYKKLCCKDLDCYTKDDGTPGKFGIVNPITNEEWFKLHTIEELEERDRAKWTKTPEKEAEEREKEEFFKTYYPEQ